MKIIVCVKCVPSNAVYSQNKEPALLDRIKIPAQINPFDYYAIEEALKIKDKFTGSTVTIICMGPITNEEALRQGYHLGVDEVILLTDQCFVGSDTLATSYVLKKGIEKLGQFDLILCGQQSVDGDTGQVGPMLAVNLEIPFLSNISNIEAIHKQELICTSKTDYGIQKAVIQFPAVLTVQKGMNQPRTPSLRAYARNKNKSVRRWDIEYINAKRERCGILGSATQVLKIHKVEYLNHCEFIEGEEQQIADTLRRKLVREGVDLADKSAVINTKAATPIYDKHESKYRGLNQAEDMESDNIYVFIEQVNGNINPVGYELLGEARRLIRSPNEKVCAILLGNQIEMLASELIMYGADYVYVFDQEDFICFCEEIYMPVIEALIRRHNPSIVLFGATVYGRSLAAGIASRLHTGLTADCTRLSINPADGLLWQTRPALDGNVYATIVCKNTKPQMATIRPGIMKRLKMDRNRQGFVIKLKASIPESVRIRMIESIPNMYRNNDLGQAKIILAVGMGIASETNIRILSEAANEIGAYIGATRPVVDAGMLPNECQIGQTGKIVRPQLYIACGISGSLQHISGMQNSRVIVAINTDEKAPIFQAATYGIVGDAMSIVPKFFQKIHSNN